MNPRRLYRCRHDRQLAGVAAGMAEYLDVDPTVVRILWILSIFVGGFTLLLYVILAFVIPLEPVVIPGAAGAAGGAAGGAGPAAGDWADTATVTEPGGAPGAIPGWAAPDTHAHRATGGGDGRGGLFVGVLLVVFGGIALANAALPGWVAAGILGPAFLVAIGVAVIAMAATRRSPVEP